ncbi:MAG: FAD-dependent oxidoreductase [Phycisphaeraceae bacterium]
METHIKTPALIVGGTTGGVAAALALGRNGVKCLVAEPTALIGGQLTAQAVPPDENRWIEGVDGVQSATRSYLDFRERVRQHYRQHPHASADTRVSDHLNPGGGWVSRLCFEPVVGHAVLQAMLKPYTDQGLADIRLGLKPVAADTVGDRIAAITLEHTKTGDRLVVEADYVLDATDLGDVYPLAGVEHFVGADGGDRFGELHARGDQPNPADQQSFCWCFALEHRVGEDHRIDKPRDYDAWRSFVPDLNPPWPGPLFSWEIPGHDGKQRTLRMFAPPDDPGNEWELWRYRRIVDPAIYAAEHRETHPEVSLVNWVQMDYFRKPLLGVGEDEARAALAGAREQSACLLYWLQTEAPRPDGGAGWRGLRLHGEALGTDDGFALSPYIREPRRLDALAMLTEAHVGAQQRLAAGVKRLSGPDLVPGEAFEDAVAIGSYHLDLHPTTGGFAGMYVASCPYRIPARALLPKRIENLVAAGKALGVSHLANGCTRLHPVEWGVGEAGGELIAQSLASGRPPHAVAKPGPDRAALQARLDRRGVPRAWPWD